MAQLSAKQRAINQSREMLEAMGQPSEKEAKRWVIYFNRLKEQQAELEELKRKGKLQRNRRTRKEYFRTLAKILQELLNDLERPEPGFIIGAGFDSQGVWVELWTKYKETFKRAIRPCGDPKIDLKAVWVLVGSADDTMWHLANRKATKSGILLP